MKSSRRLTRPESWLPLTLGVIASAVLGFYITPLFDDNVGAYIQSVSTILLVAVTITYVFATQAMAETAERQLNYTQRAPVVEAVNRSWQAFARIQRDLLTVNLDARLYVDQVADDPNVAHVIRTPFVEAARRLDSFRVTLEAERHLLPKEVADVFGRVLQHVVGSMESAIALDKVVWNEITTSLPDPPNLKRIPAAWRRALSGTRSPDLTWETYTDTGWLTSTIDLIIELDDVCKPYFPTFEGSAEKNE